MNELIITINFKYSDDEIKEFIQNQINWRKSYSCSYGESLVKDDSDEFINGLIKNFTLRNLPEKEYIEAHDIIKEQFLRVFHKM